MNLGKMNLVFLTKLIKKKQQKIITLFGSLTMIFFFSCELQEEKNKTKKPQNTAETETR